jgi:hypothetical protein
VERLQNKTGNLTHSFIDGDKAEWAIILHKLWNGNYHVVFFTENLDKRKDMEVAPADLPHSPNYLVKEMAVHAAKTKGPINGYTVHGKPPRILLKAVAEEVLDQEDDEMTFEVVPASGV